VSEPLDVVAMIAAAAADPAQRLEARRAFTHLVNGGLLAGDQARQAEIRPSDFGSCRLSLWAEIHGQSDIPRDPIDDRLTRLDMGSLIGAWEACLLLAHCTVHSGWVVRLEFEPIDGGHIDALATSQATGEQVPIEFKSSYDTGAIKDPLAKGGSRHHCLQLGDYATRTEIDASRMILVYVKPAAKKGSRIAQFELEAAPWAEAVVVERSRLAPALWDDPPTPDPQTFYACYTCRYGACPENKNRAATVAALDESDFS
jgi:hypothetical protein